MRTPDSLSSVLEDEDPKPVPKIEAGAPDLILDCSKKDLV